MRSHNVSQEVTVSPQSFAPKVAEGNSRGLALGWPENGEQEKQGPPHFTNQVICVLIQRHDSYTLLECTVGCVSRWWLGWNQGKRVRNLSRLCVFSPLLSLSVPSQALKEFQLEFQIRHTCCGFRGSESEPPARAAAGLQDGAGSQATAAAPHFLPPCGC